MLRLLVLLVASVLQGACTGADVTPPVGGHPNLVELDAGRVLGPEIEWGDLHYFDATAEGRVVALDRFKHTITLFEPGHAPSKLGREGRGPGEISDGGPIVLLDDRIVLSDGAILKVWSLQGREESTEPVGRLLGVFATEDEGALLTTEVDLSRGLAQRAVVLGRRALRNLSEVDTLAVIAADSEGLNPCLGCGWRFIDGRFFVSRNSGEAPFVVVFDSTPHDPTPLAGRWREPVSWPADVWQRRMERSRRNAELRTGRDLDVTKATTPPDWPMPVVNEWGVVGGDAQGRIWIRVQTAEEGRTTFDLYDVDEGRVGTVVAPGRNIILAKAVGRWLVGVEEDDLGRRRLVQWHIPDT